MLADDIERTPRQVIEHHLGMRRLGDIEEDIRRNYSPRVVLLTCDGVLRGHDGVRRSARLLRERFPGHDYEQRDLQVEGEVGFLEWSGARDGLRIVGADSYVVREGKIVAQTIHYRVTAVSDTPADPAAASDDASEP